MKILIVEDDENKTQQIETFLLSILSNCLVDTRKSYNSGLRQILSSEPYDLLILDITMPTYDIGLDEDGGRPQHYAGRAILRQMKRYGIRIPTVVVTQFDVFGEGPERMTREELHQQLRQDHADIYLGTVYYNAAVDGWKGYLRTIISSLSKREGV